MNNISAIWSGLDMRKRVMAIGATLAVFAAVLMLSRGGGPQLELLYSGMDAASAGEVVAALDAESVPYEVRGGSIYVDSTQRDRLRMTLASKGLPSIGSKGYELLDGLSGFGTTSKMFDAAYWRAKEGELARTIVSSPSIRSARVHISTTNGSPFERNAKTSAAVTISSAGGTPSTDQVKALRFLVAAAVSGLNPSDVAIIDDVAGLLASGDDDTLTQATDARSAELKARAERLLNAHVGRGNAVVEVSLEAVTARETVVERLFDPESRIAISAETENRKESQQGTAGGAVTVASNLPDGEANGAESGSSSQSTETRERTNFEVSETQREVQRSPGDIKRLTVAVLLNHVESTAADGSTTLAPRTPEEIEKLTALVSSAVGLDLARGDVITIDSLPFQPLATEGSVANDSGPSGAPLDMMQLIKWALSAIVAIVVSIFVLRPILTSGGGAPRLDDSTATAPSAAPSALPDLSSLTEPPSEPPGALAALPEPEPMPAQGFPPMAEPLSFDGFQNAFDSSGSDDSAVTRLRSLIEERQDEALQILQSWVEESPDTTQES